MFNLDITHNNTYGEISQPNPIRWRIMYRKKNTLHSQSGLIKCKDFFNDLVAKKKTKKTFKIYGFDSATIKFNKFGLYLLLTEIHHPTTFISNVEKTLNEKLKEQLNVEIKMFPQGNHSVVIMIPTKLWTCTYYISLATMVLRLCNYAHTYECWDDLYSPTSPINTVDGAFTARAKNYTKQNGFILPEKYLKYWFFASPKYNSRKRGWLNSVSIVHNNGCSSWCNAMEIV